MAAIGGSTFYFILIKIAQTKVCLYKEPMALPRKATEDIKAEMPYMQSTTSW